MSKKALAILCLTMLFGASSFPILVCKPHLESITERERLLLGRDRQEAGLPESVTGVTIRWDRTYGATNDEEARAVIRAADGGFLFTGYTEPFGPGNWDAWLVKTDTQGAPLWSQTYGGAASDVANSIIQMEDGGFVLAGETWSYGAGNVDAWLVKTDPTGTAEWNQAYGGKMNDGAHSVIQTGDEGFAFAGWTTSFALGGIDFWLVKTDSSGKMQWDQTYGGSADDEAWTVIQMADGGFSLMGFTYSYGSGKADFWLVRTDFNGRAQWMRAYGGAGDDMAWTGIPTIDGGFLLAGSTNSSGAGGMDGWLVKTDVNGVPQWNRTYGGSADDAIYSLIQTADSGFAFAGYTNSSGSDHKDFWVVKLDANGDVQWTLIHGGPENEAAKTMIQTTGGEFVLAGWTTSFGTGKRDAWLVKAILVPETTTTPKTTTPKTTTVPERIAVIPTFMILAALAVLGTWRKRR